MNTETVKEDAVAPSVLNDGLGLLALKKLSDAVKNLAKIKDGKTLFEGNPSKDNECFAAWMVLNNAMANADMVLDIEDMKNLPPNVQIEGQPAVGLSRSNAGLDTEE